MQFAGPWFCVEDEVVSWVVMPPHQPSSFRMSHKTQSNKTSVTPQRRDQMIVICFLAHSHGPLAGGNVTSGIAVWTYILGRVVVGEKSHAILFWNVQHGELCSFTVVPDMARWQAAVGPHRWWRPSGSFPVRLLWT